MSLRKNMVSFTISNHFEKYSSVKSNLIIDNLCCDYNFSIIIPTFKRGGKLLYDAIRSAINQTYQGKYEILIVDNDPEKSLTETERIIKSFNDKKIKYYKNEINIGMFGNWNRCIELAKSKWVCLLHDDDFLDKNYLQEINSTIIRLPSAECITSRFNILNERLINESNLHQKIKKAFRQLILKFQQPYVQVKNFDFLFGYSCPIVGACFLREKAIALGGFDESFYPSADYLFIVKFNYYFNNVFFLRHKPIYNYRIFSNASLNIKANKWFFDDFDMISLVINTQPTKIRKYLNYLNISILKQRFLSDASSRNIYSNEDYKAIECELENCKMNFLKKKISIIGFSFFKVYKNFIRL